MIDTSSFAAAVANFAKSIEQLWQSLQDVFVKYVQLIVKVFRDWIDSLDPMRDVKRFETFRLQQRALLLTQFNIEEATLLDEMCHTSACIVMLNPGASALTSEIVYSRLVQAAIKANAVVDFNRICELVRDVSFTVDLLLFEYKVSQLDQSPVTELKLQTLINAVKCGDIPTLKTLVAEDLDEEEE